MRKIGFILSELALFASFAAPAVFAQGTQTEPPPGVLTIAVTTPPQVISPAISIGRIVGFIVGAAVVIGILLALLFIVIGAIQWITSGGDKAKVESARNHIIAAIIGLIIIVLTIVIVNFVLQLLGLGSLTGLKITTLQATPTP